MKRKILDHLKTNIIKKSIKISDENFLIRGIRDFTMNVQPNTRERIFSESGIIVATSCFGTSFYMESNPILIDTSSLVGQDGRYVKLDSIPLEVAILDACYAVISSTPNKEYILDGNIAVKSIERAKIIVEELMILANSLDIKKPSVLVIGVVKTIVEQMLDNNINPILSDMDSNIIGTKFMEKNILNGELNANLMDHADIILVTGMTIATSTIDDILEKANSKKKPIVIYAQTGSNFAQEYIDLGIKTVISENYPRYCLPGCSTIKIYRGNLFFKN